MRKRNYAAISVKRVDVERLLADAPQGRLVLSLDIAKTVQYGALMVDAQNHLLIIKWRHPEETGAMLELVERLRSAGHTVEVAMEPTGTYGDAIRYQLQSRGFPVYRVKPLYTKRAQEIADGVPSLHDPKAAFVVGWLHLRGASQLWTEETDSEREGKAATRLMNHHKENHLRALNLIEGKLARHWPEATEILDLSTASLLNLLVEFGGPHAVAAEPKRALKVLHKASRGHLKPAKAKALVESASKTTGVPALPLENKAVMAIAAEALRARQLLRDAKKQVNAIFERNPVARRMAQMVGLSTAAVFLAWVGSPMGYEAVRAFYKGFGINLAEVSSGKKGQTTKRLRISKRGSAMARHWLYLAALRWLQDEPIVRAWYLAKVRRDGGVRMKAVVAVMRKLAAALWHVGRGAELNLELLFDTQRLELDTEDAMLAAA